MHREHTSYREYTPWHRLAHAVLWGVTVLACYPILAGWDDDLPGALGRGLLVASILLGVAAIIHVAGGLTVLVQETRIFLHLGRMPLIRTKIAFADIRSLRSVEYRPIAEFGGWGVRGFGRRRAWSARGDRAVALELLDGREILIGSDHPQRLEERLRTLAGDTLGGQQPE